MSDGIGEVVMFGFDFHPTEDLVFAGCMDLGGFVFNIDDGVKVALRPHLDFLFGLVRI